MIEWVLIAVIILILVLVSFCAGAFTATRVGNRTNQRLLIRREALQEVIELQQKRIAHDSPRVYAVRDSAGPPAIIHDMRAPRKRAKPRRNF